VAGNQESHCSDDVTSWLWLFVTALLRQLGRANA
jgi:hypothetical protein